MPTINDIFLQNRMNKNRTNFPGFNLPELQQAQNFFSSNPALDITRNVQDTSTMPIAPMPDISRMTNYGQGTFGATTEHPWMVGMPQAQAGQIPVRGIGPTAFPNVSTTTPQQSGFLGKSTQDWGRMLSNVAYALDPEGFGGRMAKGTLEGMAEQAKEKHLNIEDMYRGVITRSHLVALERQEEENRFKQRLSGNIDFTTTLGKKLNVIPSVAADFVNYIDPIQLVNVLGKEGDDIIVPDEFLIKHDMSEFAGKNMTIKQFSYLPASLVGKTGEKLPTPPMFEEKPIGKGLQQKFRFNEQTREYDIPFGEAYPIYKPEEQKPVMEQDQAMQKLSDIDMKVARLKGLLMVGRVPLSPDYALKYPSLAGLEMFLNAQNQVDKKAVSEALQSLYKQRKYVEQFAPLEFRSVQPSSPGPPSVKKEKSVILNPKTGKYEFAK